MTQQTASDPWGDAESPQPTASDSIACPHCGTPLVPHFDTVGALHCYDPRCVNCCFLPPDDSTPPGVPRTKLEARPCPMAVQKAAAATVGF
jgi:hypothetical protein